MLYDTIIVGQGLAGSTLAWALLARGVRVLVIDRPDASSASRVAAGLVTPMTGRALGQPTGFQNDLRLADQMYTDIQARTGANFWTRRPALRLFPGDDDTKRLAQREAALSQALSPALPPPASGLRLVAEARLMQQAARLDVPAFLAATRQHLAARHAFAEGEIRPEEITPGPQGIRLETQEHRAQHLVFCGGAADLDNPWLAGQTLRPAKGEILTVRIHDFAETRTTHRRGYWLLPTAEPGHYHFGATYDHDDLSAVPTARAREKLGRALGEMIDRPFEIVDHRAGLRPVGQDRQPFTAAHPVHTSVLAFNGLGSRGVLWAPALAQQLAQRIAASTPTRP